MNYWICIVNRVNWKVISDKNIWGVSEKHKNMLSNVKKGDKLVFYIIREIVFAGIYEVVSEMYKDYSKLFEPNPSDTTEAFPYRIKIAKIKIAKEPVPLKSLISDLEFITNKENWGGYFFGKAIRTLPKNDFFLLERMLV